MAKPETPEQLKVAERLHRYIQREGLVSVMNDTKWEKLRVAMLEIPGFHPLWREQYLRSDPIAPQYEGNYEWTVGPPLYRALEWVDIDPIKRVKQGKLLQDLITDYTDAIKAILRDIHVPFSSEGRYIRVWGYVRPGSEVRWA